MGNGAGKPLDEDTRDILSRTNNLLESTNGLLRKNEALLEEANKTLLQRKEPPDDLPNDRRIVQIPQRSVSVATDDRERLTNDALTLDLPLKHPSIANAVIGETKSSDAIIRLISHPSAYIDAESDGIVDVKFDCLRPCQLSADIHLLAIDSKESVPECITAIKQDTPKQSTVSLQLTKYGHYVLYVYAKVSQPDEAKVGLQIGDYDFKIQGTQIEGEIRSKHVYTCLIFYGHEKFDMQNANIRFLSQTGVGEICLKFTNPDQNEVKTDLKLLAEGRESDEHQVTTSLRQVKSETDISFKLKDVGTYVLYVYAKEKDQKGPFRIAAKYQLSYNHFQPDVQQVEINCAYSLISPRDEKLLEKSEVDFALKCNDAHHVAVLNDSTKQMKQLERTSNVWKGQVKTGVAGNTLTVLVFPNADQPDKFIPVLKYTVTDSQTLRLEAPKIKKPDKPDMYQWRKHSSHNGKDKEILEREMATTRKIIEDFAEKEKQLQKQREERESKWQAKIEEMLRKKRLDEERLAAATAALTERERRIANMDERERRIPNTDERERKIPNLYDRERKILSPTRPTASSPTILSPTYSDRFDLHRSPDALYDTIQERLLAAIESRQVSQLKAVIVDIEKRGLTARYRNEVTIARNLLESLQRVEKINNRVQALKMNSAALVELRNYNTPPNIVLPVVQAMLLLLGIREDEILEWWQCKSFLKTNDLFRLINRFDVRKVEPEVANRVRQVLGGNKLKAKLIVNQSKAAAAFYAWTTDMLNEFDRIQAINSMEFE